MAKAKTNKEVGNVAVDKTAQAVAPARKRTTKTTAKKKTVKRKAKKVTFSTKAKNALVYTGQGIVNFGYATKAVVASNVAYGLRRLADVID